MSAPRDDGVADLQAQQRALASQVLLRDGFPRPPATVAGVDVRVDATEGRAQASAVLLDAATLAVRETHVADAVPARVTDTGLSSFAAVPALLAALQALSSLPDLVLVAGHGIDHPARLGLAAHLGVASGLPCIGVAGGLCLGTAAPLHDIRGAYTPVRDDGRQIGWLLRSRADAAPLVVSPGHRVAMASAADLVMRWTTGDRMPEPLRLAAAALDASPPGADPPA